MKIFFALLAFVRGIHWSPVNSPHKGQWCGALMFSLIWAWMNGWVNNREAGDLRCHRTHYDVIVMAVYFLQAWHCSQYGWVWPLHHGSLHVWTGGCWTGGTRLDTGTATGAGRGWGGVGWGVNLSIREVCFVFFAEVSLKCFESYSYLMGVTSVSCEMSCGQGKTEVVRKNHGIFWGLVPHFVKKTT